MHTYSTPIEIKARDERLRDLIAADMPIEQIAGGCVFTEGPVWDGATGSLIFSDIIGNTMYCRPRHAACLPRSRGVPMIPAPMPMMVACSAREP